jgi:hypothetical protein
MANSKSLWLRAMRLLPQGSLFLFGNTELGDIHCYEDGNNRTCILIPIGGIEEIQLSHQLLKPRCFHHSSVGPVLEISWESRDDDEIGILFYEDLIGAESFHNDPVSTLAQKLLVWKDFLVSGGIAQLNELIGLWGELYVASTWSQLSPYWVGPASADIDYKSETFVFDVKTTRSKHSPEVRISTEHQLDWQGKRIFICRIRVEEGARDTGFSLRYLYSILKRGNIPPSTLAALDRKVSVIKTDLLNLRFDCREIDFFELSGSAAFITKTTLLSCIGNDAANRISGLTYNLSLSGLESMKPDEFVTLVKDDHDT